MVYAGLISVLQKTLTTILGCHSIVQYRGGYQYGANVLFKIGFEQMGRVSLLHVTGYPIELVFCVGDCVGLSRA